MENITSNALNGAAVYFADERNKRQTRPDADKPLLATLEAYRAEQEAADAKVESLAGPAGGLAVARSVDETGQVR